MQGQNKMVINSFNSTDDQKNVYIKRRKQAKRKQLKIRDWQSSSWDVNLERIAKEYAPKCVWVHNSGRGRTGENLYATTEKLNVEEGVRAWAREANYYTYESMTCEKGKMCGHYTQVIWATTDKVGCADQFCETVKGLPYKKLSFLVCNYLPPGNILYHKPYNKGTPCSECPDGFTCHRNLCSEYPFVQHLVLFEYCCVPYVLRIILKMF
uniref:SCP domain-containing protein n=1 Tax=Callorhinchus milii TaxID=7868 RepID=A0A4W3GXC1_CALMI